MSLVYLFTGFIAGIIFGVTAAFLILRWKIKRQLGSFQDDMEDLMDMTGDMSQDFDDIEGFEPGSIEKEEKED